MKLHQASDVWRLTDDDDPSFFSTAESLAFAVLSLFRGGVSPGTVCGTSGFSTTLI